jgi:hypothetical protein
MFKAISNIRVRNGRIITREMPAFVDRPDMMHCMQQAAITRALIALPILSNKRHEMINPMSAPFFK